MAKKKQKGIVVPHSPAPWRWHDNGRDLLDANGKVLLQISDLQHDADANVTVAGPALVAACNRMRNAILNWGPTDDGTPEGQEVENALDGLMEALLYAKYGIQPEK